MVTNNTSNEPTAASGKLLQGQGIGAASNFSTATYPSTATSTGTILRADGTNWVATTATYPTTTTSQQILYSSAANAVSQITTANSSLAATNSSGTIAMRALSTVIQVFTGNGTYTPTTGMLYCIIECIGGGGGGGACAITGGGTQATGSGGGSGEYARGVFSAATIGVSQSVTVGALGAGGSAGANNGSNGSTTSVGALISAGGGSGGAGCGAGTVAVLAGGSGGTGGSGGSFRSDGISGKLAFNAIGIGYWGGGGASSFLGGGCPDRFPAGKNTSTGYGAGGCGAASPISTAATAGGDGTAGIVVITEFVIN